MELKNNKIAVLCNYELLPTRVGGMDYFFWLLDQKCKENNREVDWFFPNTSTNGNYPQLTIISTNYQSTEVFFANYCLAHSQKYSHVITHFVEVCSPVFKPIKLTTKANVIVVDHNPRPVHGYSLKKKLQKRIKGFLYSRYIDTFVGVSEYSKSQLIKEFGSQLTSKTVVVFNGLEQNKYRKKTVFTSYTNFVVASHLRKEKGIQDLIRAVTALIKSSKLPFTITIYGSGNYEPILKEMIIEYRLESYFEFKGSVSNLHELYADYDYLIHPSHGETFCYSVVESLLSHLPVITTRNQGNVLGLVKDGENGFLFEEGNSYQLKEILLQILTFKKHISSFDDSNANLKKLTLENMVENHYKLIQS